MKLLKDKTSVLLVSHYSFRSKESEDTDRRILNFFVKRTKKVVLITHPLHEFKFTDSYINIYLDGKEVFEKKAFLVKNPLWLNYLSHIFIIYYFLLRYGGLKFDLCIACEDLSFAAIFPLRLLGLVRRVVYYTIDFVPKRFENNFLDKIYHLLDSIACKYADSWWVMTKAMQKGRRDIGVIKDKSAPVVVVPIGYNTKAVKQLPVNQIDMNEIVCMGGIRKSAGVYLVVKAIPLILRKMPNLKLTFIGIGKEEGNLKKLVKELKITKSVRFLGYIKAFDDLAKIVSKKSIGLATYKPDSKSFSNFSDPSRIKLYMICGLPVITTAITTMTNLIKRTKSGVVIEYKKEQLAKAVVWLLTNKRRYAAYKYQAMELSKKFDDLPIFIRAAKCIPD